MYLSNFVSFYDPQTRLRTSPRECNLWGPLNSFWGLTCCLLNIEYNELGHENSPVIPYHISISISSVWHWIDIMNNREMINIFTNYIPFSTQYYIGFISKYYWIRISYRQLHCFVFQSHLESTQHVQELDIRYRLHQMYFEISSPKWLVVCSI